MEPGLSVQIIWPLAAEEAIAGRFEYIEPAHLLNAILKFAELEDHQFKRLVEDDAIAAILAKECNAAREALTEHGIEVPDGTTTVRRALRDRLGQGGYEQKRGRVIHRSQASREACDAAEEAAQTTGQDHWDAAHLLTGVLTSPSAAIADVLAEAGVASAGPSADTPVLDTYGRDLTAEAREGNLHPAGNAESDPVCKVLLDRLLGATTHHVLLIQASARTPDEVVALLAQRFAGDAPPKGSGRKRIVEVSLARLADSARKGREIATRMSDLLNEVSRAGNVIPWFSALHRYFALEDPTPLEILEHHLATSPSPIIASITQTAYDEHLNPNPTWKRTFHAVWLHDIGTPLQL